MSVMLFQTVVEHEIQMSPRPNIDLTNGVGRTLQVKMMNTAFQPQSGGKRLCVC